MHQCHTVVFTFFMFVVDYEIPTVNKSKNDCIPIRPFVRYNWKNAKKYLPKTFQVCSLYIGVVEGGNESDCRNNECKNSRTRP